MVKFAVTEGSLDEDVRRAAKASQRMGYGGLVVPSRSRGIDLTELGETGSREYRHVLASSNQALVAIDSSLGKAGFSPAADVDRALSRLSRVLPAAAELGRSMVCLDVGPLPPPPIRVSPRRPISPELAGLIIIPQFEPDDSTRDAKDSARQEARDPEFESAVNSALKELGQLADQHKTIVAMRSSLASFASLDFALKNAACPWFGVDLDTVHMLADDWTPDEIFSQFGGLIRHVRARDAVKGAGGRVRLCDLGAGSVDWNELSTNLEAAGYSGWVTVDTAELPDAAPSAGRAFEFLSKAG